MFTFRLLDEDGVDLGLFVSSEPIWVSGDHIPSGGVGGMLEVIRVVNAVESGDVAGCLIVKAI